MKIERLTSRPDGTVAATLKMASGDQVEVIFMTARRGGVTVASPNEPVFEQEELDAASVRAVVSAVLAFHFVAAHSADQDG